MPICLPVCLTVCLSASLSVHAFVYLSVYPSAWLSVRLPAYLLICLFPCPPAVPLINTIITVGRCRCLCCVLLGAVGLFISTNSFRTGITHVTSVVQRHHHHHRRTTPSIIFTSASGFRSSFRSMHGQFLDRRRHLPPQTPHPENNSLNREYTRSHRRRRHDDDSDDTRQNIVTYSGDGGW